MRRLTWKRQIAKVMRPITRESHRRVVLLYHSIGDSPWAVSKDAFAAQIDWLSHNTTLVPLDELLGSGTAQGLTVAITFDDGYTSLVSSAAAILRAAGTTATVYLNTGWIDDDEHRASDPAHGHYPAESFLSWKEVCRLRDLGWTIGSHGVEHVDLTNLAAKQVEHELATSKRTIEDRIGVPCMHFSYTWGRHNAFVRDAVQSVGYRYAAAAVHGPVRNDVNPLSFPRINIHKDYTLEDFKAMVCGDWDYLGWIQRLRLRS